MNRKNIINNILKNSKFWNKLFSISNYTISWIQKKLTILPKDEYIYKKKEDLPKAVTLEACSLCQLNCRACYMRIDEKRFSDMGFFGYLRFKDFKKFVDDNPQIKLINLAFKGEIFLNPELDKIIMYAYKKNIELVAGGGVNLNDLSEEMAEILVKYKFRDIFVSIDGASPEIYKIYRREGDFNKVIENIKNINKYKEIYKSEFPRLTYKFIVFGHNEHEIELAKQKAKELNMTIRFDLNNVPEYSPIKNKEQVSKETGLYLYEKPHVFLYQKENLLCNQLFENPHISWNGDLLGCCIALDSISKTKVFDVNVFKVGLKKALNSKKYIEAKHTVTNLLYKSSEDIVCKNCWYYKNILKKENISL